MPLPNFYIRMCIDKMSENYQVSIDRVKAVLPTSLITESLKRVLKIAMFVYHKSSLTNVVKIVNII